MLKDKSTSGNTSAVRGKTAEIRDNSMAAIIGNSAVLASYGGHDISLPIIQRMTVSAQVTHDSTGYKVSGLSILGRPTTGYKNGDKEVQGNHTLSVAAFVLYQQEMVAEQSLTDVIKFYDNLSIELEAESLLLEEFHKKDVNRYQIFQERSTLFKRAMTSLNESVTKGIDSTQVCTQFTNMVHNFNEMYAASAYATDGISGTGQKRESLGINHLKDLKNGNEKIALLKLFTLVDFDAINEINQQGYTTAALLQKTGNISMGVGFDGNILTPSGDMDKEGRPKPWILQNIGALNPAVMRLMIMAARIQNKHRAGMVAPPRLDARLSAELPEGVPSQSGALINLSRDMLISFADTGSISPLLSRSLQPDQATPERTYPIKDSSEIDVAVTNMAVCACNVIAHQLQKEYKNDVRYDDRRVTRNYIFQYLQGILLCDHRKFAPLVKTVRDLLNTQGTEKEKQMTTDSYCAFYKQVHLKLCSLVVLPTYCKVIPELELISHS